MDAPTDAQLIAGSVEEPVLFSHVFDRHYEAVRLYLGRRVEAEIAQELAAEAFTTAFDRRRRYDLERPSARPWLLGIATNVLRHHRRSEVRRLRAMAHLDARDMVPDGTDAIDARLDAARLRKQLAEALAALPEGERDVLLLHAWADLDHADIAQALDIPVGTVRSRLHRARQRLRGDLALPGPSPIIGSPHEVTP